MNCREGDLAFYVGPADGITVKRGAIVRCVQFQGAGFGLLAGVADDYWYIEHNGETTGHRGLRLACRDAHLRPLRDDEGEDEIIRIAGKPEKNLEAA